jgi:hypothetical protein
VSGLTTSSLLLVGLLLASCTRGAAERSPERRSGEQAEDHGGQTGDEGSVTGTPAAEPGLTPYCERAESYGPGAYLQHVCGLESANPGNWSYGEPTPAGNYRCSCAGRDARATDASDCGDALARACGVDIDGPLPCGAGTGSCWPKQGDPGGWSCRCASSNELVERHGDVCEDVLFAECFTAGCVIGSGRCDPLASGEAGYECACTNGERSEWPGVFDCQLAASGCLPSCETGAGGCGLRYGGFACICNGNGANAADAGSPSSDGGAAPSSVFVSHADSYTQCGLALELACGPMPAGEQTCSEEDEHGITTCTSDGRGDWDCDPVYPCPTETDPSIINGPIYDNLLPGAPQDLEAPQWVYDRSFSCIEAVFNCRPDLEHPRQ